MNIGILLSVSAMICWAMGDFLTQRAIRRMGKFRTILFSTFLSSLFLLPFILSHKDLLQIASAHFPLLALTAFIALFSAGFGMEAFKRGKLSIVEPIIGFELPLTVLFSIIFLGETVTFAEILFISLIFGGLLLSVTQKIKLKNGESAIERGIVFAGAGAIFLALSNFMAGYTSRETSPFLSFGTIQIFFFLISLTVILARKNLATLPKFFREHYKLIILYTFFNTAGWLSYGFAVHYLPISIVIPITEAYIALAAILGILANKEKITFHQKVGIILAIAGVIALSSIAG